MTSLKKLFALGLIASAASASSAFAVVSFDADVTNNVIFGTGNGNGFWTVGSDNNVELGLRAKVRYQGIYNSNGDGTYNHDTGISSGTAGKWNFEFAINVDQSGTSGLKLSDYHVSLSVDIDPSEGVSWVTFNPFDVWYDNSFGDNSTAQSGGVEAANFAGQDLLQDAWSIAQNSQNIGWLPLGHDVNADATYDFKLAAVTVNGAPGAETTMRVIVGNGGAPVPDTGSTLGLLGAAILAVAAARRRLR